MFEPSPLAPAQARGAARELVDLLPAGTYRDLRVVVTELVTNAVQHAPDGPIRLWLSSSGSTVRGEVTDTGVGEAEIQRAGSVEGEGLGLQIVDALCSAWCNPRGTGRVWFELGFDDLERATLGS